MDARYTRILIAIATTIVVLLVALVVVLATGGDDEPGTTVAASTSTTLATTTTPPTTAAPTTTAPPATTTTAPPATTTSSTAPPSTTTTTTAPAGACSGLPSTPVAGGATDQTAAFGDLDGDGGADTMVVYRDAGAWWLNVETHYGWSTEIPLTGMVARAIDVVDLGVAEQVMVAQIDAGASVEVYGLFAFQGCGIVHIMDANTGFETALPVGGTVTHLDGFTCRPDGITVTSAAVDPDDPTMWEYTETDFLYVPGLGELQPTASSIQLLTSPADDATIYGAGDYDC
ncbi:MAG: hypothetical protein KQH83_08335 [Actinobacteria bacterium]|nr:hypothetical protein [Actinomycetota bacterium]